MEQNPPGHGRTFVDLAFPFRIVTTTLFAAIVVLTILQVFFRFVLGSPLIWSEEAARLCVVWMTFVGAAVVCWDGTHLNVDVLFRLLPERARARVRDFNVAVALVFLCAVIYFGWPLVVFANRQFVGSMDLPLSVLRVSGVVGAFLMIAFILLRRFYRRPRETKAAVIEGDVDSVDVM